MSLPLDRVPGHEPIISTDSTGLGDLFSKEIVRGTISILHGPDRAPVSYIAHLMMKPVLREGGGVLFFDSSSNFRTKILRDIGLKSDHLERITYSKVLSTDDLVQKVQAAGKVLTGINLVVIDSLVGLLNLSTELGTKKRQRKLAGLFDAIRQVTNKNRFHLTLTNHAQEDWKSKEFRALGGNVTEHAVDTMFLIKQNLEKITRITVERGIGMTAGMSVIVNPQGDSKWE